MIEFLCPEGHKIRCGDEQAGRPAKCPRCGVKFRIPTLEELRAPTPPPPEPVVAPPEAQPGPAPVADDRDEGSTKDAQIEFLCPNGHHLHGPASLQGRPGECPECGSRFRIPSLEELAAAADEAADAPSAAIPADEQIMLDEVNAASSKSGVDLPLDLLQVLDDASRVGSPAGSSLGAQNLAGGQSAAAGGVHPLGQIFRQLWAARSEGSRVEVHLESGGVLLPDGYVKGLSEQSQAVLVTKDPDNTYTLTIIPWDSVVRVILRGIQAVPGEVVR